MAPLTRTAASFDVIALIDPRRHSYGFELDQSRASTAKALCRVQFSLRPKDHVMKSSTTDPVATDRGFVFAFRMLMAWTFLYAASHQGMFNPKFSAVGFLSHTKTFHDVYAVIATPAWDQF